jgi:hypothetical protein
VEITLIDLLREGVMFKYQRFPLTLLFLTFVIIGCSKSTKYQDYQIPAWAHQEAELISLCLSGELEPPERLSQGVLNELAAIRSTYGDEFEPITGVTFFPPWQMFCFIVAFVSATAAQVAAGEYHAWDTLNERYHVSRIDISEYSKGVASLSYEGQLHPRRLAQLYSDLPGVTLTQPNYSSGDWPNVYPRMEDERITYLFRKAKFCLPSGCLYSEYWYFVFSGNLPVFVGHWIPYEEPQPDWWDEAGLNRALYYKF